MNWLRTFVDGLKYAVRLDGNTLPLSKKLMEITTTEERHLEVIGNTIHYQI